MKWDGNLRSLGLLNEPTKVHVILQNPESSLAKESLTVIRVKSLVTDGTDNRSKWKLIQAEHLDQMFINDQA